MISVSLSWIAEKMNGRLIHHDSKRQHIVHNRDDGSDTDVIIRKVNTDTQTIEKGSFFVALVDTNFNAHDFIARAEELGAAAIVVSQDVQTHLPTIRVENTTRALGDLAAAVKSLVAPKTVGIAGTSGKTTVKEMVSTILEQRGKVLTSIGKFNNEVGVSLNLLELQEQHEFAVVEMSADFPGDISCMASIVKPDVVTITNASAAYLDRFGSLFGVARAKSEILSGLSKDGRAILNQDSQFCEYWRGKLDCKAAHAFSL